MSWIALALLTAVLLVALSIGLVVREDGVAGVNPALPRIAALGGLALMIGALLSALGPATSGLTLAVGLSGATALLFGYRARRATRSSQRRTWTAIALTGLGIAAFAGLLTLVRG